MIIEVALYFYLNKITPTDHMMAYKTLKQNKCLPFINCFSEIETLTKEIQRLAEKRGEDFTEDTTGMLCYNYYSGEHLISDSEYIHKQFGIAAVYINFVHTVMSWESINSR